MFKQQLRDVFAPFKPKRPLLVKICIGLGLVPTLAAAALGTYAVVSEVWTVAYTPFDLSGFSAVDAVLKFVTAGFIWGFALIGWLLLVGLARGHAGAALWWVALIALIRTVMLGILPRGLPSNLAAAISLVAACLFVAAFFVVRRRQPANQPPKPN